MRETNSRKEVLEKAPVVLTRSARKTECWISRQRYLPQEVVSARFCMVPKREAPSRRRKDFLLECQVELSRLRSSLRLSGVMPAVRGRVLMRIPSCFLV